MPDTTPLFPEISFASCDPDQIESELIAGYELASGRKLYPGDPIRLFLTTIAAAVVQERFILDDSARNNLRAYARGEYLDALGDLVGVTRLAPVASICTLQFNLAAAPGPGNTLVIPAGTRVAKAGTQYYFATDVDLVIGGASTSGTVSATCETEGAAANGFAVGEINAMVDVVAGVTGATNTTATSGGSDEEGDEGFRTRIRLAPTAFSVAGPRDAYEYWARTASAQIVDVSVVTPSPGNVDVYVLLTGGALPEPGMLDLVTETLSADNVRPLTDNVTAKAPTTVNFTVNITYYIRRDDTARAAEIQAAVSAAVADYTAWQISEIGRDVNPSELIERVMAAGAKRVAVTSPTYAAISDVQVAVLSGAASVTYGGIEDG
jgi:phage-related baseplate assembly protein